MKKVFCVIMAFLLFIAIFRAINNAPPISMQFVLKVLNSIQINLDLSEFARTVSDISNFFTGFKGQFPEFEGDTLIGAIKSIALYVWTFMEMFANFVGNSIKLSALVLIFPVRALWAFMWAFLQLLGVPIGDLPSDVHNGWLEWK